MRGYNLRQGKRPRIYWVRRKELFVWECMHFYWMNTQHKHLNMCTFGAWELGRSSTLLLSSDRQDDGLAAGGERESRCGLLRWPWCFLPGPHAFLRTSDSWRGAVAVPTAAAGLGLSLRWEEPGADEDLDLVVCCWKARCNWFFYLTVKSTFGLFNLCNGKMAKLGLHGGKNAKLFGPDFHFVRLRLWPRNFISVHP